MTLTLALILSAGAGWPVASHTFRASAAPAQTSLRGIGDEGGGGVLGLSGNDVGGGGDAGKGSIDGASVVSPVEENVSGMTGTSEIEPGASMIEYMTINGANYQYDPDTQSMEVETTGAQGGTESAVDPQHDAQVYTQVLENPQQDDVNSEPIKTAIGTVATRTTVDLFRMGHSAGLKLVTERAPRVGVDIFPDEQGMVYPGQGGSSTFETMNKPVKWWKLPAETQLPDGLQARNDTAGHWPIEPAQPMTVEEFRHLLLQLTEWQPAP